MREEHLCPSCGTSIEIGVKSCPACSTDLEWHVSAKDESVEGLVKKVSELDSMMSAMKDSGEEIDVEEKMDQAKEMIERVEKLVFWAEKYNLETKKMQTLLAKSKEELDVGDWEKAIEYAERSMNTVLEPLKEGAKNGIRRARRELKRAEGSGRDVSQLKETIDEAERALNEKDIKESIELLHQYQEYSVDNISESENEG